MSAPFDPVCAIHGKRRSEHACLYCCLCFKTLTPDECWVDGDGQKWDMCVLCGTVEAERTSATVTAVVYPIIRADVIAEVVATLRRGNDPDDDVIYVRDALDDAADFIEWKLG